MAYALSAHPHVRASDSLGGRYWTAAALLFPCVIIKIIISCKLIVLFSSLFILAGGTHFFFDLAQPFRLKNAGWRQGFLVLWIFLWFLMIPAKTNMIISLSSFIFPIIFLVEFFGGLGAYPIHPVLGGVLILRLFFQQEPIGGILEASHFFIWNCASILFVIFGGIYLGVQKKIRLIPAVGFITSVLLLSRILGRSVDLEFFYVLFILGFYILTDTVVSPLKPGAHLFLSLGAGACMIILLMFGHGVLMAGVLSLSIWNLSAQGFDSVIIVRRGLK